MECHLCKKPIMSPKTLTRQDMKINRKYSFCSKLCVDRFEKYMNSSRVYNYIRTGDKCYTCDKLIEQTKITIHDGCNLYLFCSERCQANCEKCSICYKGITRCICVTICCGVSFSHCTC